jgi:hypothetical protein
MVNRAVIMLRYKEPAVCWINAADPYVETPAIDIDKANQERTVYLVSDEDGDGIDVANQWVKENYETLFESELDGWYTDPELWPEKRTFKLFKEWFDVECHSVLVDTVGGGIYDDET